MKNKDFDIPRAETFDSGPVTYDGFTEDLQIFWGPGPTMSAYPAYTVPTNWRNNEQLNIPRVVRMLYAVQDLYDTNGFNDATTPPVPPVPPAACLNFRYAIEGIQYGLTKPSEAYDNNWNYFVNGSLRFIVNLTGSQSALEAITLQVTAPGGVVLYSGTAWDAYPTYLSRNGSRYVAWWVQCDDGLGGQIETFLTNNLWSVGTGDPNQPPRCWLPSGVSEVSYGTGAYVFQIRNWYGCSETPGGPPVTPPPPNPPPV